MRHIHVILVLFLDSARPVTYMYTDNFECRRLLVGVTKSANCKESRSDHCRASTCTSMSVHMYRKMTLILNIALSQSENAYKKSYDVIKGSLVGARHFLSVDKSVDILNFDRLTM